MKFSCWLPIVLGLSVAQLAAQPTVDIYPRAASVTRLAVSDFVPRSEASAETQSALKVFNQVLLQDLEFSALFEIPSRSFHPSSQALRVPTDLDPSAWSTPQLNPDFVSFGNLQVYPTAVVVEAYLFDLKTEQQVLGKRYTVAESQLIRRVAHQFADEIVFQLSAGASRGVGQSQIAFTSAKGGSKEIFVMDYDGENVRTITANGGLNKFPVWSPDGGKLAFVAKLSSSDRWQLWIQDLAGGRAVLPTSTSYVSSPAISPDGERLAFSSRAPGGVDPDIFVAGLDGSGMVNLTRHSGIDTSPTWSPTGTQIAFISDRSGSPQLWLMDSDGGNVRRLVAEGGHCDSPSWSPDGRYILYSWQAPRQRKHDIYIAEVATGRLFQLTFSRTSSESPDWSPDGRHITFQSDRTGSYQVFIMNRDGKNLKQITTYGINGSPSWSVTAPSGN